MTNVLEYVMAETVASDECYGSDGIFKKSTEKDKKLDVKTECNTIDQGQLEKNDLVEEFSILPSYAERYPCILKLGS